MEEWSIAKWSIAAAVNRGRQEEAEGAAAATFVRSVRKG